MLPRHRVAASRSDNITILAERGRAEHRLRRVELLMLPEPLTSSAGILKSNWSDHRAQTHANLVLNPGATTHYLGDFSKEVVVRILVFLSAKWG